MHKYIFLDGIRGIAALFVVIWHTTAFWGFRVAHAYLAVDLFFLLSGFVIGSAYEAKLANRTMNFAQFVKTRVIRLYPVYFLSIMLTLVNLALQFHQGNDIGFTSSDLITSTTLTLFFLPSITSHAPFLFTLNPVYWSLFYELTANFLFAIFRRLLNTRVLLGTITTLGIVLLGGTYLEGDTNFGMTWSITSIAGALTRSIFGMFYGILLFRHKELIFRKLDKIKISPWFIVLTIALVLALPQPDKLNYVYEILAIWFLFPVSLMFLAKDNPGKGKQLMVILGSASYPIYVLHEPISNMAELLLKNYAVDYAPFTGILFIATIVAGSVFLEKFIDMPIRKKLTKSLIYPSSITQISVGGLEKK